MAFLAVPCLPILRHHLQKFDFSSEVFYIASFQSIAVGMGIRIPFPCGMRVVIDRILRKAKGGNSLGNPTVGSPMKTLPYGFSWNPTKEISLWDSNLNHL